MEDKEKYHGAAIFEEQLTEAVQEPGYENDLNYYRDLHHAFQSSPLCSLRDTEKYDLQEGKPVDNHSDWGKAVADLVKFNKRKANTPSRVEL